MNVLHIAPYVPSTKAKHAGGVCMGKEIEWLSQNSNLFCLHFVNSVFENELNSDLTVKNCVVKTNFFLMALRCAFGFWLPTLFACRRSISFAIKMIVIAKKQKIDLVYAEYTSMGQYVWIKKLFPKVKFVLVEHDVTVQSYERKLASSNFISKLIRSFSLNRVRLFESRYCSLADQVICLSEKDCALADRLFDLKKSAVRINPYFGFSYSDSNFVRDEICRVKGRFVICFVGNMSRSENDEAARDLIVAYRKSKLNSIADLKVIGANPSSDLCAMADENVFITGFVEDINAEISTCDLALFPLKRGAGIKLKVLLSAELGVPVLTTSIGAEGIDEKGEYLCLCSNADEMCEAAFTILSNNEQLRMLQSNQEKMVNMKFNWSFSEKVLGQLFAGI